MEDPVIIVDYKLLTDTLVKKYRARYDMMLRKKNSAQISEEFEKELAYAGLRWLAAVHSNNFDSMNELVEGVNKINSEQRRRFADHCRLNKYLGYPFHAFSLN